MTKDQWRTAWYVFAFALIVTLTVFGSIVASLPECPQEDSNNCIWHGNKSGNGQGATFIDINGVVIYL